MLVATSSVSRLRALHCSACGTAHSAFELQRVSACCAVPLVADYATAAPLTPAEGHRRRRRLHVALRGPAAAARRANTR